MVKDGKGGAKTLTGLNFEEKVDFVDLLKKIKGYTVQKSAGKSGLEVFFDGKSVARVFKKHDFYRFLEENHIDWETIISKKLLPDNALLVIVRETLFIIEVMYQQLPGSVDDELQSCDFFRKQYYKLVFSLKLKVEYIFILNDRFKNPSYKDILDYINSVNCHYKFNELPLTWLGLPNGKIT